MIGILLVVFDEPFNVNVIVPGPLLIAVNVVVLVSIL